MTVWLNAQNELSEIVRGTVVSGNPDSEVLQATVSVNGTDPVLGTVTDENHAFSLRVPAGRRTLRISCLGFQPKEVDVLVITGRETVLSIVLDPSVVELDHAGIVARRDKSRPLNGLSFSGSRSFSTEETFRFAG